MQNGGCLKPDAASCWWACDSHAAFGYATPSTFPIALIAANTSLRTRVKICGITRVEDALAAAHCGCDAIGLVFYAPSPRHVSIAQAVDIVAALPAFVTAVGLFVNAEPAQIRAVLATVRLDLLQFHGDEAPADCRQYRMPYMKAVSVKPDTNLLQYAADYHDAKALLLDTYVDGVAGGTGLVFDWSLIPKTLPLPMILAGGLNVQ